MTLLDFDPARAGSTPRDAATIVVAKDDADGPKIFCVERNKKSRFLGGAIVFPGGKLDAADRDPVWRELSTPARAARDDAAPNEETRLALGIAALRETLEEAALLLTTRQVANADVLALRSALANDPTMLRAFLEKQGLVLDAGSLHLFARWVTPVAESRRYDTRFFLARAPLGQSGAHDMHETMASFWARPADLLLRFDRHEVQVAPPTHRTLETFAFAKDVDEMFAIAARSSLRPICPTLFQLREGESSSLALALPGDPEHEIKEARVQGRSRYVLRGEYWRPE